MNDTIKTILENALNAEVKSRGRKSDIKEQLRPHKDLIVKAIGRGHTATAVARMLKEGGVKASIDTLRASITDLTKTSKTESVTVRKPRASKAKPELNEKPDGEFVATTVSEPDVTPQADSNHENRD